MKTSKSTAITRKKLSTPAQYLKDNNLLKGRVLDYGCGRGYDAKALGAEKFDPNWYNVRPTGKFNTVYCNYVLNVVDEQVQRDILDDIKSLLIDGGTAYISVRRDLKADVFYEGYCQRIVSLSDPWKLVVERRGSYAMYKLIYDELTELRRRFNPDYLNTTSGYQYREQREIEKRILRLSEARSATI